MMGKQATNDCTDMIFELVSQISGRLFSGMFQSATDIRWTHVGELAPSWGRAWNSDQNFILEAEYFLALMDYYLLNDREAAWQRINRVTQDVENNLLKTLMRANFAIKCRQHSAVKNCFWYDEPNNEEFINAPIMHYYEGLFASSNLQNSTGSFALYNKRGGRTYLKNAQLYAYYSYYLAGRNEPAEMALNGLISGKDAHSEQDKNAIKLGKQYKVDPPHKSLLKARLLFDGGHYQRALDSLGELKEKDFNNQAHKLEYNYRKGRIYQELGKLDLAILFYREVLKKMEGSTDYYASYAALYIGEILEQQQKLGEAEAAFKSCIEICKKREYRKTVELRAKAGLKRL